MAEDRRSLSLSSGARPLLPSVGTYSTYITALQPFWARLSVKAASVTSARFSFVTVTEAPKMSPSDRRRSMFRSSLSYTPLPLRASVVSRPPSMLMMGTRFLHRSSRSKYFSSRKVPLVKMGQSIFL